MYVTGCSDCFRDISQICGFTREIHTTVIADIETREWRRVTISQDSLKPEHTRSSITDDVECFFSVMYDQIELPTGIGLYEINTYIIKIVI